MKKLLVLFLALMMCVAVFAACGTPEKPEEVTYKLDKAVAYLKNLYVSEQIKPEGSETAFATKYADFNLVSAVNIAGVSYDVVWTSSETDEAKVKVIQGTGTTDTVIDVDEKTEADINFTLTATVKAGDGTSDSSLKFNFFIPKYDVITYEEYRAKVTGDSATVEGIVVAMNSVSKGNKRNHLFLVDAEGKGGYYAYDMQDCDPVKAGIEVGMTVAVSGTVEVYSGMHEIKSGTARIINSEKTTPAAIDVTAKFGAGENILEYVGALVTIKGVTIGGQDLATATSQYLFFSLNGVESYIRTYVTDLPTSFEVTTDADGNTVCADKATIDATHGEKRDWTANVTGVLIAYSGNPYLMPVDANCFEYLEFVEKTAEEKIDAELGELTFVDKLGADKTVDVVIAGASYTDVVLTWKSDSEYAVVAADGKSIAFTIPKVDTTVKITVTGKLGTTEKSKTFEVVLTPVKVTFVENTPYFFGFTDKDGKVMYLDGTNPSNANYRWNLTDDVAKAVTFYVEATEGGYYVYFMNGETKTYINIVKNGNYTNLLASDKGESVWVYDVALEALTVELDGKVYVPKNYSGYKNVEAKTSDYKETEETTYVVTLFAKTFNIAFENNGEMQYLDGTTASNANYRWNLTKELAKAATFYVEGNADGSYYIYFYNDGIKTYINIVKNGNYTNLLAGDKAESKWVYNEEVKAYVVDVDGTLYVPKNYGGYTNVEAKTLDYTKGDTFVLSLFAVGYAPEAPEAPEGGEGTTPAPETPVNPTPGTSNKVATFELGENGEGQFDGTEITETLEYTNGGYTLTITDATKAYKDARGKTGNSCIKLGTSKVAGGFSFTVGADVKKVIIYASAYKEYNDNNQLSVNGDVKVLTNAAGEVTAIEIDTSVNKTVTIVTAGSKPRAEIHTIEFYA